jgi:hypothetical protein
MPRQVSDMGKKPGKEGIGAASPSFDGVSARIFISYSRRDGGRFAADLRDKLLSQQLSVWQDIISLEGGRDWWSQIEDVIRAKALEHFVLVVTPAALESADMRREIRLARQASGNRRDGRRADRIWRASPGQRRRSDGALLQAGVSAER